MEEVRFDAGLPPPLTVMVPARDCQAIMILQRTRTGVRPMVSVRKNHASPPAPVAESWRRIETWLEEHLPALKATLRPGVSKKDLAKFEKLVGRTLPDDVRESWLVHDGQRPVPANDDHDVPDSEELLYGYALNPLLDAKDRLSLSSVLSGWQSWMKMHGGG